MENLETLSDQELAAALDNTIITIECTGGSGDWLDAVIEAKRRLSTHPAQRIADLTGRIVTRDGDVDGFWAIWIEKKEPILNKFKRWETGDVNDFICIDLPGDNRPWQESIYRPKQKG